ncbi:MAG: oligosaccharide flippase family protein [Flavobacteriales bacterium]|nr:oligosaccharide flippase family protein [Flavobacteriales bacterium]
MGSIARQAALTTALTYAGIGLGFVNVVLLNPRFLGEAEFGLTRLFISIVTMAAQVAQLGMENTLVRYFPYVRDARKAHHGILSAMLSLGTLTSLLAGVVLLLFHQTLADIFSDRSGLYADHGYWVVPLLFAEVYFLLLRAFSRSLRRPVVPVFIREFLMRLLQTILILVHARWPMSFSMFLLGYVGIYGLCTVLLAFDLWRQGELSLRRPTILIHPRLRRSMWTYGLYAMAAGLIGIALGTVDQMMIGAVLSDGLRYVAYYAVAVYIGSFVAVPSRAVMQVVLPVLADAWRRKDKVALQRIYERSAVVQLLIGTFLFLLLWASIDDLFTLLPPTYAMGAGVTLVIGFGQLVNAAAGVNIGIISMSRSYRFDAWSSLAFLGLDALGCFVLVLHYGVHGAAWATVTSITLINALRIWFLWNKHGLWPFGFRHLRILLLVGMVLLILYWIPIAGDPWLRVLVRSGTIALLFWLFAHGLGLTKELIAMREGLGKR